MEDDYVVRSKVSSSAPLLLLSLGLNPRGVYVPYVHACMYTGTLFVAQNRTFCYRAISHDVFTTSSLSRTSSGVLDLIKQNISLVYHTSKPKTVVLLRGAPFEKNIQ